jgi:hypothetical protein
MPEVTDPWAVRDADFPAGAPPEDRLRFLLQYAIPAPSAHNTQPWFFRLHGDSVDLDADRTRALPMVDPADRELTISCGAALGHLQTAARRFGARDWLQTGQALSRVLLKATAAGVSASFLTQPVEVEELRVELARLVSATWPQLLLRLGYGPHIEPSARRPLTEVVRTG